MVRVPTAKEQRTCSLTLVNHFLRTTLALKVKMDDSIEALGLGAVAKDFNQKKTLNV